MSLICPPTMSLSMLLKSQQAIQIVQNQPVWMYNCLNAHESQLVRVFYFVGEGKCSVRQSNTGRTSECSVQSVCHFNFNTLSCSFFYLGHQAPVVQTLDSTIHRKNHYPADKYYGNQLRYQMDGDLSGRQRYPTFEQPRPEGYIIGRM